MNTHASPWRYPAVAVLAVASLAILMGARGCAPSPERKLTVVLVEYQGPEAGPSAKRLLKELTAQGLADAYVVEGDDYASVCVGRYDSWKDPAADAMLKRVRPIRDAQGQFPFAGVLLMPVPSSSTSARWTTMG